MPRALVLERHADLLFVEQCGQSLDEIAERDFRIPNPAPMLYILYGSKTAHLRGGAFDTIA